MMPQRRFFYALLAMAMTMAISAACAGEKMDPVQAEVRRFLKAAEFGASFQRGIRKMPAQEGEIGKVYAQVLKVTPDEVEETVAPAFASQLTLEQARAIADFYSSPLGWRVSRQGLRKPGEPGWVPELTPQEQAELKKFAQTPAGKLVPKLLSDPGIRASYYELLKRRYL